MLPEHQDWPGCRYKKRKRHQLSVYEKIGIVYDVLIVKDAYENIAKRYRIKLQLINDLVKNAKTNKKFVAELHAKEDEKVKKVDMIEQRA